MKERLSIQEANDIWGNYSSLQKSEYLRVNKRTLPNQVARDAKRDPKRSLLKRLVRESYPNTWLEYVKKHGSNHIARFSIRMWLQAGGTQTQIDALQVGVAGPAPGPGVVYPPRTRGFRSFYELVDSFHTPPPPRGNGGAVPEQNEPHSVLYVFAAGWNTGG